MQQFQAAYYVCNWSLWIREESTEKIFAEITTEYVQISWQL